MDTTTLDDLMDYIINDPMVEPMYTDLLDERDAYRAEGHTGAVLWSGPLAGNVATLQALWLPEIGRVGICDGGDSQWGECHSEQEMETCIVEYLTDAEAWERRN